MKILLEILPLLSFFIAYKLKGIMFATYLLISTSLFGLIVNYLLYKKVSKSNIISNIILIIIGLITLYSGNSQFIKMKPTIINFVFAIVLFIGLLRKKIFIKYLLNDAFKMNEHAWYRFSARFIIFFIILGIINEVVWRNYSEDFWVKFKVFGILPLTVLFILVQIPFIYKNQIEN